MIPIGLLISWLLCVFIYFRIVDAAKCETNSVLEFITSI
jgi:hypothetical protein